MKLRMYPFILFLFTGCGTGYELSALYSQEIEHSDKILIQYEAFSRWNDGAKCGITILDKNGSTGIIDAPQMPFSFLTGNPTKDTVFTIGLRKGGTKIPTYISTEIRTFRGMVVKTDFYAYEIGATCNLTYKFSGFRETKDSIIISGIEKVFFNLPTGKNEIGFLKGNITLVESDTARGVLKQVDICAFVFRQLSNTSIDKITVIRNDSFRVDGMVYFTFEPTRKIPTDAFTNFGVYKKRTVTDVK